MISEFPLDTKSGWNNIVYETIAENVKTSDQKLIQIAVSQLTIRKRIDFDAKNSDDQQSWKNGVILRNPSIEHDCEIVRPIRCDLNQITLTIRSLQLRDEYKAKVPITKLMQ